MSWWTPSIHADRRPLLLARNAIKAAIRGWFESQGFVEVEPAALAVSPGNETHLHAFATESIAENGARRSLYLHTSPEFAMKKLLAAGEEKLFAFSPVYRNREQGSPLHASEFTMLEWYRAGAPYQTLFDDCEGIVTSAAWAIGANLARWRERACDPLTPPMRMTVSEAFAAYAGIDLDAVLERDALAAAAAAIGIRVSADDSWPDLFSRILVNSVEPNLGLGAPLALYRYPKSEAALARLDPEDGRFSERFELYMAGVEVANGFGELTDPVEQRRRFEADMEEKARLYGERYPIDEDFLSALAAMPDASGCALGFDRLVLLLTGAARIGDVQWTPAPG